MGCLFVLIAMLSPRLGIILIWAFTEYVNRAFDSWIWPLLGLIFLPWTTLLYILLSAAIGPITFWGWLMIGLGVLLDISNHAQAYANRQQATGLYRPASS